VIRTQIFKLFALSYSIFIALILLCPREPLPRQGSGVNLQREWAHHQTIVNSTVVNRLLYLSGPLETIGNIFVFTLLFFSLSRIAPAKKTFQIALVCGTFSICVEFAQLWIPGRISSPVDVLCNLFGIFIAVLLKKNFPMFRKKKVLAKTLMDRDEAGTFL
jgi:VanZ like family